MTPLSGLRQNTQAIGVFTLLVCLIVSLIVAAFSLLISGLAYRPIMNLYLAVTHADAANVDSRRDELQVIEKNVGALISDRKDLQSQIFTQSDYLRRYFSLRLLLGSCHPKSYGARLHLYGFPPAPPRMAMLVFRLDSLNRTPYSDEDEDLLLYAVDNIAAEVFESRAAIPPVLLEGRQVTVLSVGADADYEAELTQAAEKIQEIAHGQLEFTMSAVVSRPIQDYGEIHTRYTECMEAMRYRAAFRENVVLFVDDLDKAQKETPVYPEEAEKELFSAIRLCDSGKSREMVHQFVENVFRMESNRAERPIFLSRLVAGLTVLQEETGCSSRTLDTQRHFSRLKDADEIEKWLNSVAGSVMESVRQSQQDHFRCICKQMLQIIQTEYDTKLTLESCAARLNYHPNYLRRIFEDHYGTSFSDYLMQYRIDVAKKWLVETEMRISDIADRLNYQNTSNFIRGFKKITGMTPKQYRDSRTQKTPAE